MKFHDELNQKLFNKEELKPEVKEKLKEIAEAFIDYLEVNKDAIKDVVITGSSVSYNYTKYSDIDLHLKVDYDLIHEDCPIVEGYLWACKSTFNKDHDITIYGIPVEVYAESIEEDTVHNGLYSLWQDKWIDKPNKIPPTDNDSAVLSKYNELKEAADRIQDSEVASELIDKIYQMRKAGLQEAGEFSTENLAFKKLRDEGIIERLREMKKQKIDKELSLESYNESMDYIETAIKELKETGNLKGSTILQSHCLNVGDEVIGPWEQPCKVKEYTFEESRIRYNLVNINDPRDTYEHLTAEDLAGYGNKINYEQELTSILYMEDHGKQEDLINTSYGIWSKLFKNGPIYLVETQDDGYYTGYICVTTDRMESIKELAQICKEEEAVEDLLTERKNIPCNDLYNLLASTNESIKEEVLPHNVTKVKQLIDKINKIAYFKIDGEDISVNKGFGTVGEQIDLQTLAKQFEELGFKVRETHFQITVYGLKDFIDQNYSKNESIKESEDKLDYEQFKIAKSNFGTYFVTPYDSRIGRIEGNSAVTVSNKLAAAINKYNSKSIAAERKALINKLHKLFKQAGIPKMQDMKSSIRGYRPITQNGYYIEIYKGDYTTFNIGITGNREELGNKIKEILNNEGVKYTGSVDYFTVDMEKQDTKNESIKESQEELIKEANKITNHGMLYMPVRKLAAKLMDRVKGTSDEEALKVAKMFFKETKNESLNKLEETLNKAKDMEINEGMWASPFTMENAKQVAELLAKPITYEELNSEEGKQKYWNIIGDDEFWDNVADEAFDIPEADARYLIVKFLEDWIEGKENFNPDAYSQKAEDIIKKAIFMFNGITEDMGKSIKEDRLFNKQLTPLPSKDAKLNKGDKVTIDGQNGEIIEVRPMKMSDTCTYKIKLDNGKVIWRYEEEIINEEVKTSPLQRAISRAFAESEGIYKPSLIYAAYKLEQQWLKSLGLGQDEQAPEIMLFVINNPEEGIEDTKLVKREDVYTYTPEQNEYYLDMIRDSGDVITDYNLEPAAKLVDSWNLKEDAQTLTDKVDKAEQELQDIIKMVKVGYQEDNKLINNLNKLINEALEK